MKIFYRTYLCLFFFIMTNCYSNECPVFKTGVYDQDPRIATMYQELVGGKLALSVYEGNNFLAGDLNYHQLTKLETCLNYQASGSRPAYRAESVDMEGSGDDLAAEGFRYRVHYIYVDEARKDGMPISRYYMCKSVNDCHICKPDPSGYQACANRVALAKGGEVKFPWIIR